MEANASEPPTVRTFFKSKSEIVLSKKLSLELAISILRLPTPSIKPKKPELVKALCEEFEKTTITKTPLDAKQSYYANNRERILARMKANREAKQLVLLNSISSCWGESCRQTNVRLKAQRAAKNASFTTS